jgi:hypothetical protein
MLLCHTDKYKDSIIQLADRPTLLTDVDITQQKKTSAQLRHEGLSPEVPSSSTPYNSKGKGKDIPVTGLGGS